MKTPDEIRSRLKKHLQKRWKRYLLDSLCNKDFEPINYSLFFGKDEATTDINSFERYENSWQDSVSELDRDGVELIDKNVNWPVAGGKRTALNAVRFYDVETAIEFAGGEELLTLWKRAKRRLENLINEGKKWGFVERLTQEKALLENEKSLDLKKLLILVDFLSKHRSLGCYIRELPVPGIDTKFFEKYKHTVIDLLAIELEKPVGVNDLKTVWNIKELPFSIELRHAHNFIDGIPSDIPVGIPLEHLVNKPCALVVIENRQTGLSIKSIPENIPIAMGMGFSVVRLISIPWIKQVPIFYFGDLDQHGLEILGHFRNVAPQTRSVLMNLNTLKTYIDFAVTDPTDVIRKRVPISFTQEEAELYDYLMNNKLRLEQERIPIEAIDSGFKQAFDQYI